MSNSLCFFAAFNIYMRARDINYSTKKSTKGIAAVPAPADIIARASARAKVTL